MTQEERRHNAREEYYRTGDIEAYVNNCVSPLASAGLIGMIIFGLTVCPLFIAWLVKG